MTELVLALDVTEKKKALAIAHACAPYLDAIKLGYPLILSCGLSIARELEEEDLPLIADFNVADIPNTNRLIAERGADATGRASSVVMVSSIAGVDGTGSSVAYAASKGALNTMTDSLARALAPKIRVNAVCPGVIDPRWFVQGVGEENTAKIRAAVAARVPLRAASSAEDIAGSVVFLCGADSGTSRARRCSSTRVYTW